VPATPFERSYWVEPGRLLAGAYPDPEAALDGVITFVVDLTEEGELAPYSARLERAEWVRMPIRDFSVPSDAELRRILDTIDVALDRGEVVYVHCFGGRGRTGTVVACHLVRHGLAPDDALARVGELRAQVPDAGSPSPETADQIELVRRWQAGQ
jgi:protein-tyrosine phosphatase